MMRKLIVFTAVAALSLAPTLQGQIEQSEYQARRAAFAASLDSATGHHDWTALVTGGEEPAQDYLSFIQKPRFEYLAGFQEPAAALVMARRGTTLRQILFVLPRDPSREAWTGTRLGPAGVHGATGMEGQDREQLVAALDTLIGNDTTLILVGDQNRGDIPLTADDVLAKQLVKDNPKLRIVSANRAVDALRRFKSAAEVDFIRKAVAITVDAQRAAIQTVRPGLNEFEIQALIEYTFRKNGSDRPSFSTIIGSGPNSTALHYNADDRFIQSGDVVVMDIGASYRGYAADVTRTVPANGTFTPAQRDIYQAVRDAQAAGQRQATLGADTRLMSDSATKSLTASLTRLGLIESPDATYDCTDNQSGACAQYRLYYMHGLGHPIGLEVHDVGVPGRVVGSLSPGDAFTIEPGIYVRANVLDFIPDTPRNRTMKAHVASAVSRYANIGIRIEDDYVMTDHGVEWISTAPRELDEIEALMKSAPKTIAGRDSAKVEWYRSTAPHGSHEP